MNRLETNSSKQAGFTIVELMVATAVFAVVLLIVSLGLLQIGRTYYKGVTSTNVQQTSRGIIDQISQAIQFSGGQIITSITPRGNSRGFCIDNKRYSYELDQQVIDSNPNTSAHQNYHAFLVDDLPGCNGSTQAMDVDAPTGTYRELLGPRMRLSAAGGVSISLVSGSSNLYSITINIIAGDDDVLNPARTACTSGRAGTQFCAASNLTTTVKKRL